MDFTFNLFRFRCKDYPCLIKGGYNIVKVNLSRFKVKDGKSKQLMSG